MTDRRATSIAVWLALWLCAAHGHSAETPVELRVDFGKPAGLLRPLHGINKGPLWRGAG